MSQPCPFFQKTGACRHRNACARAHVAPRESPLIVLLNAVPYASYDQEALEAVYEDLYVGLARFGALRHLCIAANKNHLFGNVYAEYSSPAEAEAAAAGLRGEFYAGRMLSLRLCGARHLKACLCQQMIGGACPKGLLCNYVHDFRTRKALRDGLEAALG